MISRIVYLLLLSTLLLAHGVDVVFLNGGQGIRITYANGDPMALADVRVFRPNNSELEFQMGTTDENGCFIIRPDTVGTWILKVSDGMGHGQVVQLDLDELEPLHESGSNPSDLSKIVSGLGYILFVFSVWYWLKNRNRERHAHP